MVGRREQEPVQVAKVAGYQDRQDLSPAVGHKPIAVRYPTSDDKGGARRFTLDDDIRTGSEAFFPLAHRFEHNDIAVRERRELRELGHERVSGPSVTPGHAVP
jgi:hypothetical protein